MESFATIEQFKSLGPMPAADVQRVEEKHPGFLLMRLKINSSYIRSKLAKRYDVAAMQASPPEVVVGWLVALTTPEAYQRRGRNPNDDAEDIKERETALLQIDQAADAQNGLFELPLRADDATATSGVSRGGPLSYSEQSPYTWTDHQRRAASNER